MKFRNLTIKSLLLAATTLAGSAAFGQRLLVTSPASLAGEIDTTNTGNSWGAPANYSINAPGILANDGTAAPTLGCTAPWANAAAVSGKVAIIDRGSCNFTAKVANAQSAGAVAAIICMATYDPLISPTGSTAQTIPVFMITKTKCNQIKAQLAANVPVNFSLGTDINLPNDMRLGPGSEGFATNWAMPVELVRNDLFLGALNRNEGANAQNGVKLKVTVSNGGTVYHRDSVTMATPLASNKDSLMIMPTQLNPTGKVGLNTITYTTSSSNPDDLPADNIKTTTFNLTSNTYSGCKLDANNNPTNLFYTTSTTAANTTKMEWGFTYKTNDKGDMFVADSVRFSLDAIDAANTTSVSVAGVVATVNVYEWDEVSLSSMTSVLAGTGQYTFAAGEDKKIISVSVKDNITLANPLRLKPNTSYLVSCKVENANVRVRLALDGSSSYVTTRNIYTASNDSRLYTSYLDIGSGTPSNGFTGFNAFGVSLDVKKIILPAVAITGNTDGSVLTATPTAGNMGPFTYRWSTTPAKTTATITVTAGGTYRVTMTDAVGNATTASYVSTLSTENTVANFGLKVFPVPANDFTTVSFDFGKAVEVADMIVTDINGRTVSTTRFNNIQNLNKVLNVSNMAAGQYFVTVRTTEGQQTAKFNVVR